MSKIKTFMFFLIPFFLGLIIGGAVAGNKAAWISGLVLLILDLVILSINVGTYSARVKKLSVNPKATAYFSPNEIVCAIVNMPQAKKVLSVEDYSYVYQVFSEFLHSTEKLLLNREKFICLSTEMIAHFDLIAPYYAYNGNSASMLDSLFDEGKDEYRQRAKDLLHEGKLLFGNEWMQLHQEFMEEFYLD